MQSFLRDLEKISHDERTRRMVDLGRRISVDSKAAQIIESLSQLGFYERLLALRSCYGSKNATQAIKALSDPSNLIKQQALKLVILYCTDEQVAETLHVLPAKLRPKLLGQLQNRRRFAALDRFVAELSQRDPATAAPLIPYASSAAVRACD